MSDAPILLDGAMGTELQRAGLAVGEPPERWLAEQPEAVKAVHRQYRDAGAQALLTNTFGANRIRLKKYSLEGASESLNRGAVALARLAAPGAAVFGSMGPTGERVGDGGLNPAEAFEAFLEQATALAAAGVEAIFLETFSDPAEAALAVTAAREAGAPMVLASFTAHHEEGCRQALAAGAFAVGANCGGDPAEFPALIARLKAVLPPGTPLIAKPGAGLPTPGPDGRLLWPVPTLAWAGIIHACRTAGATFVGGCCGTTPEYLTAVRDAK